MSGTKSNQRPTDFRASALILELMGARGWTARHLSDASLPTGHPDRRASVRTIYRVISDGYVPGPVMQFEIAQAFGLIPPHIWGRLPIPDDARYPVAA
jgi:hypothetical protein